MLILISDKFLYLRPLVSDQLFGWPSDFFWNFKQLLTRGLNAFALIQPSPYFCVFQHLAVHIKTNMSTWHYTALTKCLPRCKMYRKMDSGAKLSLNR